MVHVLTSENYRAIVSSPGIVIVDCWASWCGACKTFAPVFEKAAEKHPDHLFAKMDTEEEKALVREFEIQHVPALMLFCDGILLFRQPGNFDEEDLEGVIGQAESLDMDEVPAQLASQESSDTWPRQTSARRRGDRPAERPVLHRFFRTMSERTSPGAVRR